MAHIKLRDFKGLTPRTGEQLLDPGHAVGATNVDLDSGALRPLITPHREKTFPRAGEPGFLSPRPVDPSDPGPIDPGNPGGPGPEPPNCVPVVIVTPPADQTFTYLPDDITFTVAINAGATVPVVVRWYIDDVLIAGETGTTLTITPDALQIEYNNGQLVLSPNIPVITSLYGVIKVVVQNPCGIAEAFCTVQLINEYSCASFELGAAQWVSQAAGRSHWPGLDPTVSDIRQDSFIAVPGSKYPLAHIQCVGGSWSNSCGTARRSMLNLLAPALVGDEEFVACNEAPYCWGVNGPSFGNIYGGRLEGGQTWEDMWYGGPNPHPNPDGISVSFSAAVFNHTLTATPNSSNGSLYQVSCWYRTWYESLNPNNSSFSINFRFRTDSEGQRHLGFFFRNAMLASVPVPADFFANGRVHFLGFSHEPLSIYEDTQNPSTGYSSNIHNFFGTSRVRMWVDSASPIVDTVVSYSLATSFSPKTVPWQPAPAGYYPYLRQQSDLSEYVLGEYSSPYVASIFGVSRGRGTDDHGVLYSAFRNNFRGGN